MDSAGGWEENKIFQFHCKILLENFPYHLVEAALARTSDQIRHSHVRVPTLVCARTRTNVGMCVATVCPRDPPLYFAQWHIQGAKHARQHQWWTEPMAELLRLWARLEAATATTIRFLESAAKGAAEDAKGTDGEDKKAGGTTPGTRRGRRPTLTST